MSYRVKELSNNFALLKRGDEVIKKVAVSAGILIGCFLSIFILPLFSKTTALPDFDITEKDVRVEWVKGDKSSRALKITVTVHCDAAGCKDGGNTDVRFFLLDLLKKQPAMQMGDDKNVGMPEGEYQNDVVMQADMPHFANHAVKIVLDPKNEVQESNEKNNQVSISLPPSDPKYAREKNRPAGQKCTMIAVNLEWVAVDYAGAGEKEKTVIAQGILRGSKVSWTDWPATHISHDVNFFVKPDLLYRYLFSAASLEKSQEATMEMEWETHLFPLRYMPTEGDRVWMAGRWIFDCGHPPYHTEIHPPKFTAFTRTAPVVFTGDKVPAMSSVTYMFASTQGGYYDAESHEDYEFDAPVIKKPSKDAVFHIEILEKPDGVSGMKVTPVPNAKNPKSLHIIFPLKNQPKDKMFGAVVAAAWRVKRSTTGFYAFKVAFDSVEILNDHYSDQKKLSWWRLWADVNGHWMELFGGALSSVQVETGDVLKINKSVTLIVPEKTGKISIRTTGYAAELEHDLKASISPSRPVGVLEKDYTFDGVLKSVSKGMMHEENLLADVYTEEGEEGEEGEEEAEDNNPFKDTSGDFKVNLRIEKLKYYPAGTKMK